MSKIKIPVCFLITILSILFFIKNSYANIVFPAIAHQFMVSAIVPSYWSVVIAVLVLIVEIIFIKRLLTLNVFISFIYSFLINLLSSIIGFFITSSLFKGIFAYDNMRLGTYLGMLPGYMLTVLSEGGFLFLIALIMKRKLKIMPCLRVSAFMNVCSYLIILIGIIMTDIMTKAANFQTY